MHQSGYRTIPLCEMVDGLLSNSSALDKTVVVTFDDGFKSSIETALPILERYGFAATIFVTTGYVGQRCGWVAEGPISEFHLMTWQEIEMLHRHGFDIQPHSCSHPFLTGLTDEQVRHEITKSKQEIESRLDKRCAIFCYPYGDFNDRIISLVKQAGYSGAVTVEFGRYNRPGDVYRLARLGTAHFADSMLRFKAGLAGTYDCLVEMKRWIYRRQENL